MVWGVIFIIIVAFLTVLSAGILPRALLRVQYIAPAVSDRGIKKVRDEGGCSVVYKSAPAAREYIDQYVISERGRRKLLVCKISPDIKFMSYDVVIYDSLDHIVDSLHVDELIEEKGFTRELELPEAAAYVAILPDRINDTRLSTGHKARIPGRNIVLYSFVNCVITFGEVLLAKYCMAKLTAGIYFESIMTSVNGNLLVIIAGAALTLINFIATLILLLRAKNGKAGGAG